MASSKTGIVKLSKLYFDSKCPICTGFVALLKRKIPNAIEYIPLVDTNAKEFKYTNKNGASFSGTSALEALMSEHPEVEDYFWMLPSTMKKPAVRAVVATAGVIRQAINKVRPCNCGK